jgi:hypothetical protein
MTTNINNNKTDAVSYQYMISVGVLAIVLPVTGFISEHLLLAIDLSFSLFGKWFIFSAVGLRLFLAGIKQTTSPAFTAKEIFHMQTTESYPVVRELGFANICFGLVGIVSLFVPEWRIVSAFASGLFYGIAGLQHLINKPVSKNEQLAMWTDLLFSAFLVVYFVWMT